MRKNPEKQERPKQERRALSVEETAEVTGLSRASVYRAIGAGTLVTVKVGSRRLVPVASIEALLAEGAK
jgi:excisionase family DNA binding protein